MIASITVISDYRFCFLINLTVFHPFKMSYTTSDETVVEPYEEVVGNPHYISISRSSSPVVEEDRSMAETFKGPIVNSSIGVEITAQTGSVASAPWPALGGIRAFEFMLASRTTARAAIPSEGRRRDTGAQRGARMSAVRDLVF